MRRFMLKKSRRVNVTWLNTKTVYEGKLLSMTARVVRLYAPDPSDAHPYVDVSFDWVTPVT